MKPNKVSYLTKENSQILFFYLKLEKINIQEVGHIVSHQGWAINVANVAIVIYTTSNLNHFIKF